MKQTQKFTAIIERKDDGYVSLYPELDIAIQGLTIEEAEQYIHLDRSPMFQICQW